MTSFFRPHIARMTGYVPGEQPTDPSIIKLNTNESPYAPSPKVMKAIASVAAEMVRRYPSPTGEAFREAAARVLGVTPEMILCGNGMDDILRMAIAALTGPDAAVVLPTPTYTLYETLAAIQSAPVKAVPFGANYELPTDGIAEAAGALTLVANPNAPSGTFVLPDEMAKLAYMTTGVLAIDEAYVDFAETNCLDLTSRFDNVLVLRSMSKGYSLAGLRFGYAVGRPEVIAELMKVKDSYNVDAVSIAAATAAIEDQDHARQIWAKVRAERGRLAEALAELEMPALPSQANFLLARPSWASAGRIYESLKARKILVRYFDHPDVADRLRITVGTPEQNDALLAALKKIREG
jgi:histidinol-phosphate aminotransferase